MNARLKKGGSARFVIERVKDNDTLTIPKGFIITDIVCKKSGTVAGKLRIGTTSTGQEVVADTALGIINGALVQMTPIKSVYNADTLLYINIDSLATGTLAIHIQKIL